MIDVLCESYVDCAILWYHWPRDDYTGREDYEPIILRFEGEQLVYIGSRPHRRYRGTDRWMTEAARPVIVFTTPWHGPMIEQGRMGDFAVAGYMSPHISERIEEYVVVERQPPSWYAKDDASMTVYEYIDRLRPRSRSH